MAAAAGEAAEDEELPLPSCGTFDYGGGLREVAIVSAIEEYFSYHHLQRPLEAFRRDVDRTGLRQTPSRASSALLLGVEDVLAHFDAGLRVEFAAAWARSLPEDFRSGRAGRALELRLQAHFATLRARQTLQEGGEPDPTQLQVDLEPFRAFLGSQGLDEVCGDEALMPLFALPFVQRPHAQPLVAVVFKAKWLQDLRRDVDAALRAQHPQIPLLYDLIEPQPGGQTGQADGTAWRRVWSELLRVADFGLDAATMLAHGIPISGELLQKARRQLQMLREQVPGGLELRLLSELPIGGPGVMSPARSVRSRAATAPPQMPRDLDFGRLAHFLRARADERERLFAGAGPPPTLAAVLRALLQRLASAEAPLAQRRGFLVAVACFDVLGVRARPGALPELLADPSLAELTLGMLAVLACEAVGRTYIVANLSCVESVVEILKAQQLDSSLHIQALAAMQRLSLRRAPQDRMIELGLVEWVIGVLGWQEEAIQGMPSEFSLEFGSAMLMNLALRTSGKRKCAELDALTVSLNLMEHWNPQIRTHINGTLYSLLTVPSFRAQARRAGLEQILKSIHAQAASLGDEISRRQIEYLLEQLSPPEAEATAAAADGAESGEDDEDDDENFLEEEELAGLLLGDRGGRSAEEALRGFALASAAPGTAEAQSREFRVFLARGALSLAGVHMAG
mmetsp:Transcript_85867/g.277262  ORF Transcript_85867/g.277262 Transcript_85867/m.277262 type:complete len:682 (+) Transcript_85867:52-2097(+)